MKIRIAAAAATGLILIGVLAWPIGKPPEPLGVVSLLSGSITFASTLVLVGVAFLAGFIGYIVSWPYGREIGVLAVPSGLAVWAIRSGSMAALIQQNPNLEHRHHLLATIKFEPIFWLAVVAAGFAGVWVADKILKKPNTNHAREKTDSKANIYLKAIIALLASVLIAQFCIRLLARDVRIFDEKLGSVVAQPAGGQIAFAVFVSFGLAAFVAKKFLDAGYIWPMVAGAFVTFFAASKYARQDILEYLVEQRPAVFFPTAITSILPLQIVAFGTLGAIAGFWLAVRYNYWRKHA